MRILRLSLQSSNASTTRAPIFAGRRVKPKFPTNSGESLVYLRFFLVRRRPTSNRFTVRRKRPGRRNASLNELPTPSHFEQSKWMARQSCNLNNQRPYSCRWNVNGSRRKSKLGGSRVSLQCTVHPLPITNTHGALVYNRIQYVGRIEGDSIEYLVKWARTVTYDRGEASSR